MALTAYAVARFATLHHCLSPSAPQQRRVHNSRSTNATRATRLPIWNRIRRFWHVPGSTEFCEPFPDGSAVGAFEKSWQGLDERDPSRRRFGETCFRVFFCGAGDSSGQTLPNWQLADHGLQLMYNVLNPLMLRSETISDHLLFSPYEKLCSLSS